MSKYRLAERTTAQLLQNLPGIDISTAKFTYRRLNYWLLREGHFTVALHPQATLMTPAQWAETDDHYDPLFFGYFDKSPWSADGQKALFHRLCNERQVEIRVYDRQQHMAYPVGISSAWNWQQGSMAQWLSSSSGEKIIFNDIVNGRLIARLVTAEGENETIIPWPVQVFHPGGNEFLSINYRKLDKVRPDYGYNTPISNFDSDAPLDQEGIWRVDLDSGQRTLIINLETLAAHQPRSDMVGATHYVNHLLYAPGGTHLVFLHRWMSDRGILSRLYRINADGSDLRLLLDDDMVSHYCWRNQTDLLAWARTSEMGDHYYLIDTTTGKWQVLHDGLLDKYGDGHPSFSPDGRWILTDSYPDRKRQRHLVLYNLAQRKLIEVGQFFEPWHLLGIRRCDLHPRWSPDGTMVSVDAAFEGKRRTYIVDIQALLANGA